MGRVLVARSISGVRAILIGADDNELVTDLAVRFPEAKLVPDEAVVLNDLAKVTRFVDKPTKGLDLLLDLRGTPVPAPRLGSAAHDSDRSHGDL
jgi:hypothetical protein